MMAAARRIVQARGRRAGPDDWPEDRSL